MDGFRIGRDVYMDERGAVIGAPRRRRPETFETIDDRRLIELYRACARPGELPELAERLQVALPLLYHRYRIAQNYAPGAAIYSLEPSQLVHRYEQTPEDERADLASELGTLPARLDQRYAAAKELVSLGVEQAPIECRFCHKLVEPHELTFYSGLVDDYAPMHDSCASDADMES
jgi:hypothetical protein